MIPVALKVTTVDVRDVLKQVVRALEMPSHLDDDYVVRNLGYFIVDQEKHEHNLLKPKAKEVGLRATDTLCIVVVDELAKFDLQKYRNLQHESIPSSGAGAALERAWGKIITKRLDAYLQPLLQLGEALVQTHKKGMYHRDFKPKNVLLVNGRWKIADWGTVKRPESEDIVQTMQVGTQHYLPPEAQDGDYNHYTDAFAFGIVVYEILVGQLPPTRVSNDGNDDWFRPSKSKFLFQYQHKAKDHNGADAGIGAKLEELMWGLTKYNHEERWSTQKAWAKLNEIAMIHDLNKFCAEEKEMTKSYVAKSA